MIVLRDMSLSVASLFDFLSLPLYTYVFLLYTTRASADVCLLELGKQSPLLCSITFSRAFALVCSYIAMGVSRCARGVRVSCVAR